MKRVSDYELQRLDNEANSRRERDWRRLTRNQQRDVRTRSALWKKQVQDEVNAEIRRPKGALWSSHGPGYGGYQWPFDIKRAIRFPGYCKGLVAATKNPAYDSNWRNEAKRLIDQYVYPVIHHMALVIEDLEVEDEHGL